MITTYVTQTQKGLETIQSAQDFMIICFALIAVIAIIELALRWKYYHSMSRMADEIYYKHKQEQERKEIGKDPWNKQTSR